MDDKLFKHESRMAACTSAPWEKKIPWDKREAVMRQIRQETIEAYGYSMDECPNRMVCLKKECMGRQLPWKSETARPYLEELKASQKIENDLMYITTDCHTCPVFSTCRSPCNQVTDFINRDKVKEPTLYLQPAPDVAVEEENAGQSLDMDFSDSDIPWDSLSVLREKVVKTYLYEQKDFKHVADVCGLSNQARAKYEFYAALTTLSEWAAMRELLCKALDSREYIMVYKLYKDNMSQADYAKLEGVSKQAISNRLNRVISKYNVKWPIFVKKVKGKVVYNVPGIMK